MWCSRITKGMLAAIATASVLLFTSASDTEATCSVHLAGSAQSVLRLSVADYSSNASVFSAEDDAHTSALITFGDHVGPHGSNATARFGLKIKSNCAYAVRMSRSSWTAQNLLYKGKQVAADDGGSFVRIASAGVTASGAGANPSGTILSPNLHGAGMSLAQVTSGPVTPQSTLVAHGERAATSGGMLSDNNDVILNMNLSCVDGDQLAPREFGSPGFFQTTVQFQVFPQRP